MNDQQIKAFEARQRERGGDSAAARKALRGIEVETPSWGYGDQGTRFRVFPKAGVPRDAFEKFEDAGIVHRCTGISPSVAIHIPWDKVADYEKLKKHAEAQGVRIGAVNPNLFQEEAYMLGSVCHSRPEIRKQAVAHMLECVEIMRATGSTLLSLWFADGTNYPGQADIRSRKHWLEEGLAKVYAALDSRQRMLIEYKFFEPAFYHTDLADWGMAYNTALKLGPQAQVLVDTGHHAQGTNIEHLVAYLIDEGRLGGFHFNARRYADDDLIVGSVNPYELFLIFYQIQAAQRAGVPAQAQRCASQIAYMIDQSHNIEPKIPAMIRSVLNVHTQYAKALLINWSELEEAQKQCDVLRAEAAVREAFEQDVTPLLLAFREESRLPADPMQAYRASGYQEKIEARRKK